MIAGTGSGCGKTTVTCAILAVLNSKHLFPRAFKCGPDYIDPMFHYKVLGVNSCNLDSFLCDDNTLKYLFAKNTLETSISIIEGVMGFYDGVIGLDNKASSYEISNILNAPVILVVNSKGKALSIAAQILGYVKFSPNNIVGVIINGASASTYNMYKNIIEKHVGIKVYGYIPHIKDAEIPSRKLGLVSAEQICGLRRKIQLLSNAAKECIEIDSIIELAKRSSPIEYDNIVINRYENTIPIAIAKDEAFCFYYKDSLDLLEKLGARFIPFSPVNDYEIPSKAAGIIFGGGYPELYAKKISNNTRMLNDIRKKADSLIPIIAECGGFMLLCNELITEDGECHKMSGIIDTYIEMTNTLNNFGYITLESKCDNMLCGAGETINAHEFHYSRADDDGEAFCATKVSGRKWDTVFANDYMYAGYPHLHLWGNINFAKRFFEGCKKYYKNRNAEE